MTNYEELALRIEAGEVFHHSKCPSGVGTRTIHGALGLPFWADAELTKCIEPDDYLTSLDAAKALHDAVLPGWDWFISNSTNLGDGRNEAEICNVDAGKIDGDVYTGFNEASPAAAWVAAILRAKGSEK